MPALPFDADDAVLTLSDADPTLAALIHVVGPFTVSIDEPIEVFEALCQAIVHQQLSGKAAGTIYGRFLSLLDNQAVDPRAVAQIEPETLRSCGLSRAKTAAILDLADKSISGLVPPLRDLQDMSDSDIIDRLTQVRGIGTWSVQMLLMFRLGRPDVFPAADLGVRKGFALVYGRNSLPNPKEFEVFSQRWRPFRTVAAWYFWRALELDTDRIPTPT